MLRDAIDKIEELTDHKTTLLPDVAPDFLAVLHNGKIEYKRKPRRTRFDRIHTLDDLLADAIAAQRIVGAETPAEVWYSEKQVVLLRDPVTHDDQALFTLQISHAFAAVSGLGVSAKGFSQKGLISYLRTTLADLDTGNLLHVVRSLNWRRTDNTQENDGAQASLLGRTIERQVASNTGELIPESIEVDVPVYVNVDVEDPSEQFSAKLKIVIEVDYEKQEFCLSVNPDDVQWAIREAQAWLRGVMEQQLLESVGVRLIAGVPSTKVEV